MTGPRGYLLDTDVLWETRKTKPAGEVIHWLNKAEPSELYVSVLALGELRKGVAVKHPIDPDMARKLGDWVDGLEYSFADRILDVDATTARIWGELTAERSRPVVDTLLAATAIAQNLVLVTRNVDEVRDIKLRVINPWDKR
jgi:predicted nucleic acid-binding protein